MIKVYLAGPDVFLPNAKEHAEELKRVCAEFGLEGVFPLDAEIQLEEGAPGPEKAQLIFDANVDLIRRSLGVLANMTPFRGPSMDVGTAWEMGFAHALGLPIVGYTDDNRLYPERVRKYRQMVHLYRRGGDPENFMDPDFVEDFDLEDNLMLDCSTKNITSSFRQAAEHLSRVLSP